MIFQTFILDIFRRINKIKEIDFVAPLIILFVHILTYTHQNHLFINLNIQFFFQFPFKGILGFLKKLDMPAGKEEILLAFSLANQKPIVYHDYRPCAYLELSFFAHISIVAKRWKI